MLGAEALDRDALAIAILDRLSARIERWQRTPGPDPTLVADYHTHSLTVGSRVRALLPGIGKSSAPQQKSTNPAGCSSTPTPTWSPYRRATSPT